MSTDIRTLWVSPCGKFAVAACTADIPRTVKRYPNRSSVREAHASFYFRALQGEEPWIVSTDGMHTHVSPRHCALYRRTDLPWEQDLPWWREQTLPEDAHA